MPRDTVTWTNGTPQTSNGGDHAYIWANGELNTGYSFTVPADTSVPAHPDRVRQQRVNTTGKLTAHLSDGSAADFVATPSGAGLYNNVYTITYGAAFADRR